jgi:hypothetical protein
VVGPVLLLLAAAPAGAMVVVEREFPELVARAEQIVVGMVTEIEQADDASGAPSTFVTFSDLSVLKGDVGETLTLRFYGGVSGDAVVRIPDMPTFSISERAVLFVAGNGRDICPLVGVWQGRFRVRFDTERGTDVVESNDRTPVVGVSGGKLRRAKLGAPAEAAPMALSDFLEAIAGELAHPSLVSPRGSEQ